MSEKLNSELIESASDHGSPPRPSALNSSLLNVDLNAPRRRYAFGAQGKTLMRTISACGAIGFLLFGYDQGVLGVSIAVQPMVSLDAGVLTCLSGHQYFPRLFGPNGQSF